MKSTYNYREFLLTAICTSLNRAYPSQPYALEVSIHSTKSVSAYVSGVDICTFSTHFIDCSKAAGVEVSPNRNTFHVRKPSFMTNVTFSCTYWLKGTCQYPHLSCCLSEAVDRHHILSQHSPSDKPHTMVLFRASTIGELQTCLEV